MSSITMRFKQLSAVLFAILIVIGVIIRTYAYKTGSIMIFMGTLYLLIYYLVKIYKELKGKSDNKFTLFFQLVMVLMSVVIFGKYLYMPMGYFIGLIIIPFFIISAVIYWIKAKKRDIDIDLMIPSIIYFILSIPMFANMYGTPFENYYMYYYPQQYIKHNDIAIDNSFDFQHFWKHNHNNRPNEEATALALQAHILANDEKRYEEAIVLYRQIITMENPPDSYMYYQLSDCYIRTDQYDLALNALDSAIILEPEKAEYYSTRGWLYLYLNNKEMALRDIEKSLDLNSTAPDTYLNLAYIYYLLDNNPQKAYEAFKKAEHYNAKYTAQFSDLLQQIEEKLTQE